jgi:hypothetical protein
MIGETFSRLTVVETAGVRNEKRMWKCRCECGSLVVVPTGSLRSGNSKSCGCLKIERQTKHGQWQTRTYHIWQAMLNRCRQEQHAYYYGDKTVCPRWRDFTNFIADMGEAPDGMSIDRIDNDGDYTPDNCRWATQTQQTRNTRRRKEYEFRGERHSLIEWAEKLGVTHELLRGRIRRGWRFEDAAAQ